MSTPDPTATEAARRRAEAIREGLVSKAKLLTEKLVHACNRKDLVVVAGLFQEGADLLSDYSQGSVHVTHTLTTTRKVKP